MTIHTPEWVKHAVFYQIFPDRFRRSGQVAHPRGIQFKAWGASPAEQGYQGGDLYGIVEKLDYLKGLGINALYLNPIFAAATNHRYNAYDYLQVDPLLGGNQALRVLLDEAHRREIKVVLDGVFNHCGRGFWAFHHILENGGNSPYIDWFTILGWPLNPYPDRKHKQNYLGWWGNASLPKFNTNNPGVRDYLLHVTRYWLEFGIDGWRLDVPEDIKDDTFWQEFRQVVKSVNPDAYIVGEIWHEAAHWLQGDMFDAVMNYQITAPIFNFFGAHSLNRTWKHTDVVLKPINASRFQKAIETMFGRYDWQINFAQMNMLDSHDMPRALWLLKDNAAAFHLAVLCQMTMPGAPCVYYGDEVGLSAGGDPFCREAFPWEWVESSDHPFQHFYRQAIALRNTYPALRTGDFSFAYAKNRVVAYRRSLGGQLVLVVFNTGLKPVEINLPSTGFTGTSVQTVWSQGAEWELRTGKLHVKLPAQQALVMVADSASIV